MLILQADLPYPERVKFYKKDVFSVPPLTIAECMVSWQECNQALDLCTQYIGACHLFNNVNLTAQVWAAGSRACLLLQEIKRETSSIWATFKRDPLQPVRDYIQNYGIVGVGLFLEGYVIFSISNISTLFKHTYYECWSSFQICNKVRFPRPCLHLTASSILAL